MYRPNRTLRFFILPAAAIVLFAVHTDPALSQTTSFSVSNSRNDTLLFVNDSGKVGIGTTTPAEKLHVAGTAEITGHLTVAGDLQTPDSSSDNTLRVVNPHATGKADLEVEGTINTQKGEITSSLVGPTGLTIRSSDLTSQVHILNKGLRVGSSFSLWNEMSPNYARLDCADGFLTLGAFDGGIRFETHVPPAYETRMYIADAGNVGIGTTSPAEKLDVAGTAQMAGFKLPTGAASGYVLTSDEVGAGSWQPASAGADNDWTISGNNMYSAVSGNVGIGTTSPGKKLEVSGASLFSGDMRIDGNVGLNADPLPEGGVSTNSLYLYDSGTYSGPRIKVSGHNEAMLILESRRSDVTSGNTWYVQSGGGTETYLDMFAIRNPDDGLCLAIRDGGNVGIGEMWPKNRLDVEGPMAVGSTYSGTNTAPPNGMIIEGNVGIGTTNPAEKLDIAGTAQMTGFKLPTGASNGFVLTSDASGVGTWQAASGGSDNDWTISGSDMYSAVSGNVGIGTSTPNEKLVVEGGNFYVKNGSSLLKGATGGARVEYFSGLYLEPGESYCEVQIQGANPGDAALVVEAHRIYGNGSGYGAAYGKQSWVISCEGSGSTNPQTIVEYPGEYDEASDDKITLDGVPGPILRVRFHRKYDYDNGSVRVILLGAFNPETTTFTTNEY